MSISDKTPKELMEYRDLGRTDLKVSLLSSGAWVTFGEQLDINEAYNCIKFAYDNVCNFFDNAEVYSFGKPETAMDEVLKRMFKQDGIQRTNLVILTKIFWDTSCYHPQAIKANLKGLSRKRIVEDNMLHRIRFEVEYDNLYKPPISYGVKGNLSWLRQQFESGQVENLHPIADKLDATIAQLALAWAAKNPNVSTVITGASRSSQVTENFKALTIIPELISDIIEEIEQVLKNKPKHPYDLTLMN
ncbi:unnamed protein product [Adineta steineri]|uniref:NADP-dependent oxidoreductase domain-containing protein n=1 Tax=Adineta steineri TaxID=433720 RepID=A0A818NMJ0_9BILA|nr:unnamed protein product [Adineta steineri]